MSTLDVLAQDAEARGSIAHESPYFSSNSAGVTGLSDKITLGAEAAGAADSTRSIEKEFVVLPGNKARALAEKTRKASAKDTTGQKWYGMPATKITPEIETTLKLMKLRHVFNPKHFMKKDKSKGLPKYFQIGTVVDAAQDFYSEGTSKKKRKKVRLRLRLHPAAPAPPPPPIPTARRHQRLRARVCARSFSRVRTSCSPLSLALSSCRVRPPLAPAARFKS